MQKSHGSCKNIRNTTVPPPSSPSWRADDVERKEEEEEEEEQEEQDEEIEEEEEEEEQEEQDEKNICFGGENPVAAGFESGEACEN